MHSNQEANPVAVFFTVIGLMFGAWYYFGGGVEKQAAQSLQTIKNQVAENSIEQYRIAKRSGNKMDACVHAGFVAAAFLQAKDEAKYREWKAIESKEQESVGIPNFDK